MAWWSCGQRNNRSLGSRSCWLIYPLTTVRLLTASIHSDTSAPRVQHRVRIELVLGSAWFPAHRNNGFFPDASVGIYSSPRSSTLPLRRPRSAYWSSLSPPLIDDGRIHLRKAHLGAIDDTRHIRLDTADGAGPPGWSSLLSTHLRIEQQVFIQVLIGKRRSRRRSSKPGPTNFIYPATQRIPQGLVQLFLDGRHHGDAPP